MIDDEDPQVKVEFDSATGTVEEGDDISFNVTLSKDPERTIIIPISVTHHDGAISDDYSLSPNQPDIRRRRRAVQADQR